MFCSNCLSLNILVTFKLIFFSFQLLRRRLSFWLQPERPTLRRISGFVSCRRSGQQHHHSRKRRTWVLLFLALITSFLIRQFIFNDQFTFLKLPSTLLNPLSIQALCIILMLLTMKITDFFMFTKISFWKLIKIM